ncbi:SOS response-associated peptidase family protein [Parasphingopyxis sp.]|uniref:SOS response-associated peptidase n=1 Tax=Parasphingopyxis sp. TaxID=1920299 RepID=UPI0026234049|nr:SOS response-associated peptidase family protein [Parasphingopyxis sp.]
MCNHFRNLPEALATVESWREYVSHFRYDDPPEEVYPKRQAVVVRATDEGNVAETMHWGFPWVTKGKRPGTTKKMNTTNVRNLKSPLFRGIINSPENRCLVPFTEFAEPKPKAGREEVWFTVTEAEISAFAGIWRPDKVVGNVFAFLTCEPNPLVKPIHPKAMPVVLEPDDYDRWLSGEDAASFQQPFPSQLMAIVD